MTYSPTQLPMQYHRRGRTLLLCSEWEEVWPLRYCHRDFELSTGSTRLTAVSQKSNRQLDKTTCNFHACLILKIRIPAENKEKHKQYLRDILHIYK